MTPEKRIRDLEEVIAFYELWREYVLAGQTLPQSEVQLSSYPTSPSGPLRATENPSPKSRP